MSARFVIALFVLAACESRGGTAASGGSAGAKTSESGTQRGSAGGFSATLSADLAKDGVTAPGGSAAPATSAAPSAASTGSPATGSVAPAGPVAPTGSVAPAGSAVAPAPANMPAGSAAAAPAKGSAAPAPPPAKGSAAPAPPPPAPAPAKGSAAPPVPVASKGATGPVTPPANRAPVKPAGPVAAINLDLEPNWERDVGEAGTFSLVVKLPNTNETKLFSVRYGYEDQNAPFDCDQYRKFLEDQKLMAVTLNRQRGAACYIEGKDAGGVVSYRYLVNYGGKRLMCHGSLYKDAASAALGDLRDKVLMQAKKICETLAL